MRRFGLVARVSGVIALAACAFSSCSAPHPRLIPRNSACFQALPVANAALHHHGTLAGVRTVSRDHLARLLEGGHVTPESSTTVPSASRAVCLVAFKGAYRAAELAPVPVHGASTGRFAMVAVTARHPKALGVLIGDRLPLHFGSKVGRRG